MYHVSMNVVIIQPPLVQLNTAYPSGAYLTSFFKQAGHTARWYDLSIKLFSEIFSREGLAKLFEASKGKALKLARQAQNQGDNATATNLYRYISQRDSWINWIDTITAILKDAGSTSGRELCHRFIFSPHAPRGSRMETYLENLDHEPSIDDARFLAGLALADLADYITVAFDREFALVRYGESLAINETSFTDIQKGINSPILNLFYKPLLRKLFSCEGENPCLAPTESEKLLVCISIPFPGTFTAGLVTAQYFKELFNENAFIVMGGGFVNTELRDTEEKQLSSFIDAISYDRGYGSYSNLFDSGLLNIGNILTQDQKPLFKLRLFYKDIIIPPCIDDKKMQEWENGKTSEIVPDYSDINFSEYPRMTDDTNPMQRIWSDGTWIKAYLAHGCYWHQCAFCDVTLDYVAAYRLTHIQKLFYGLKEQASKHGVYGIHFVDEAMPPKAMTQFATLNSQNGNSFSFWGNIRFEKVFSRDIADFLSYGGLIGVSGGIEIATGSGLDEINKGTDINSIVNACCAFKEAGILVHAYMIYGYWKETEQDLINSMETLRQLYAAGLLDSSFWHKFTLTRHSRIYAEWEQGKHPELKPIIPKDAGIFAKNGLHFAGEQKSQKYGNGLNSALNAWMHGESLNAPVGKWFSFKTPRPTIPADYIENAIAEYEKKRDKNYSSPLNIEKCWWLAGEPIPTESNLLSWIYMEEIFENKIPESISNLSNELCRLLMNLKPEYKDRQQAVQEMNDFILHNAGVSKFMQKLRGKGLIQLN